MIRAEQDDELLLLGANADLFNWACASSIGREYVVKPLGVQGEATLKLALGYSPRWGLSANAAHEIILALWRSVPGIGPYPLNGVLAEMEHRGAFFLEYREHAVHQLRVFILGLLLYDQCEIVKEWLRKEVKEEEALSAAQGPELEQEIILRWTAAALAHDVGYVLETPCTDTNFEPGSASKELSWEWLREKINRILGTPVAEVLGESFGQVDEGHLATGNGLGTFAIMNANDLMSRPSPNERKYLQERAIRAGLCASMEPGHYAFERYYQLCQEKQAPRPGFKDHGIIGAFILLTTAQAFRKRSRDLLKPEPAKSLSKENRVRIKGLNAAAETVHGNRSIAAAAAAIALHNINCKLFEPIDYVEKGLTPTEYRIRLTDGDCAKSHGPTPLAFLLALADTLQDWDRPFFRSPRIPGAREALSGIDIRLNPRGGKLNLSWGAGIGRPNVAGLDSKAEFGRLMDRLEEFLVREELLEILAFDENGPGMPSSAAEAPAQSLLVSMVLRPAGKDDAERGNRRSELLSRLQAALEAYPGPMPDWTSILPRGELRALFRSSDGEPQVGSPFRYALTIMKAVKNEAAIALDSDYFRLGAFGKGIELMGEAAMRGVAWAQAAGAARIVASPSLRLAGAAAAAEAAKLLYGGRETRIKTEEVTLRDRDRRSWTVDSIAVREGELNLAGDLGYPRSFVELEFRDGAQGRPFIDWLKRSEEVTIVGITQERLVAYLEQALAERARERGKDDESGGQPRLAELKEHFWASLVVVFPNPGSLSDVRDQHNDGKTTRRNWFSGRRAVFNFCMLVYPPDGDGACPWKLVETSLPLTFSGQLYRSALGDGVMRETVRVAQIVPYVDQKAIPYVVLSSDMRSFDDYRKSFSELASNATEYTELQLKGNWDSGRGEFSPTGLLDTRNTPRDDSDDGRCYPVVLVCFHYRSHVLLQKRTELNARSGIGNYANISGWVQAEDLLRALAGDASAAVPALPKKERLEEGFLELVRGFGVTDFGFDAALQDATFLAACRYAGRREVAEELGLDLPDDRLIFRAFRESPPRRGLKRLFSVFSCRLDAREFDKLTNQAHPGSLEKFRIEDIRNPAAGVHFHGYLDAARQDYFLGLYDSLLEP
jgi:8-oxo-dGTP pyrophosphatase MutT (NUDIX family)